MSARNEEYRRTSPHNGEKTPEQIELEISRTRAELDETLHALERKLSPGELMDQLMDYFRGGPGEFAHNLGDTVKHNPVAVSLLGLSLGWLMMSGREGTARGPRGESMWDHLARSMGGARESGTQARQRAGEMAHDIGERAGGMAESARESSAQMSAGLRERGERYSGMAREQASRARGGLEHVLREQPLLLGLIGVAVGAGLGAAVPSTRREQELMGEKREELLHKAKETGEEQLEKATQVAQTAKESAKTEAGKQGMSAKGRPESGHTGSSSAAGGAAPGGKTKPPGT